MPKKKGSAVAPHRRWKSGDIAGGWRLVAIVSPDRQRASRPYQPRGWWKAVCTQCGTFERMIHPSVEISRSSTGCRSCAGKASRKPRECRSCGTKDVERFGRRKAPECMACDRSRLRNGSCEKCGSALSNHVVGQNHVSTCERCVPWAQIAAMREQLDSLAKANYRLSGHDRTIKRLDDQVRRLERQVESLARELVRIAGLSGATVRGDESRAMDAQEIPAPTPGVPLVTTCRVQGCFSVARRTYGLCDRHSGHVKRYGEIVPDTGIGHAVRRKAATP